MIRTQEEWLGPPDKLAEHAVYTTQIQADARAVIDIAEQMQQLQSHALSMTRIDDVERRGYLTPSEDETTRHLLVAYWQMRSALLETVFAFRDHVSMDEQHRQQAFLVAFAAALVERRI